jgi:hypothetical protein
MKSTKKKSAPGRHIAPLAISLAIFVMIAILMTVNYSG